MSRLVESTEVTVFVVEDSAIVRERLVSALNELDGVRVIGEASDAAAAVDAINRLEPSVVTLDLQLESGTGWDVLERLTCRPSIFVLTNFAEAWFRRRAEELRVARFFDKSKELEDLLESVRALGPAASAET